MTRKYIVGVSALTKEQEEAFIAYLKESRVGWWHWIKGMWLITDRYEVLSVSEIRDKLRELTKPARSMVIEVSEKTPWAGSGPKLGDKNMFRWMRETWNADSGDSTE